MQIYRLNYTNTYANVANINTIQLLLAMACFYNQECNTVDIVTAFLNKDLKEEVYINQIKGFKEDLNSTKVYKLLKSIYKLKKALQAQQQRFYKHFKKLGFT